MTKLSDGENIWLGAWESKGILLSCLGETDVRPLMRTLEGRMERGVGNLGSCLSIVPDKQVFSEVTVWVSKTLWLSVIGKRSANQKAPLPDVRHTQVHPYPSANGRIRKMLRSYNRLFVCDPNRQCNKSQHFLVTVGITASVWRHLWFCLHILAPTNLLFMVRGLSFFMLAQILCTYILTISMTVMGVIIDYWNFVKWWFYLIHISFNDLAL